MLVIQQRATSHANTERKEVAEKLESAQRAASAIEKKLIGERGKGRSRHPKGSLEVEEEEIKNLKSQVGTLEESLETEKEERARWRGAWESKGETQGF
ncbi:hypothetical protein HDV00_000974 [Rhizophlyctis rosea]|nr:hypothetical protein HDV00_000974 [Rhizophlyctis rosea]